MTTTATDIADQISNSHERLEALTAELAAAEMHVADIEAAHRLAESAQQRLAEVSGEDALGEVPDHALKEARAEIEQKQAEIRQERAVLEKLKERQQEQAVARAEDAVGAMGPVFDARDEIAADVLGLVKALLARSDELEAAEQKCLRAHRFAAQVCSAAGLPKPEYRKFLFRGRNAVHEQFKGRRVMVQLINSFSTGV